MLQGKDVDIDISPPSARVLKRESGVEIRHGTGRQEGDAARGARGRRRRGARLRTVVEAGAFLSALGRGGAAKGLNVENAARGAAGRATWRTTTNLVAESTEGDCRVFVAGDTVKDCAIYPGGLLSTGLAQGHAAARRRSMGVARDVPARRAPRRGLKMDAAGRGVLDRRRRGDRRSLVVGASL